MDTCTAYVMDSTAIATALETGDIAGAVAPVEPVEPAPKPESDWAPAPGPHLAITTTVKDLRAALMACGKIVPNRSSLVLLECVQIEATLNRNGQFVEVRSTDLDVMVEVSMAADVVEAGTVTVPLKPLKKALVKRKAGEAVTIEAVPADSPDGSPWARVNVGDTEFRMAVHDAAEFVAAQPAECLEGELAEIPESALAGALADCEAAQSDEFTCYYLNGVMFRRTAGATLRTVATDGHRLHIHETGWHWPALGVEATDAETGETEREPQVIVPRLAVSALLHVLKGATADRNVMVESDGARFDVMGKGWRVLTKLVDGRYPDIDRVAGPVFAETSEDEPRHVAELQAGATRETMLAVKAASTERSNMARLHFAAGEVRAGSIDTDNYFRHPLARVNGECGLEVIGLNAAYLADIAACFDESATFTMTMTDAGSPIGIESSDKPGFRAVVMPLRV